MQWQQSIKKGKKKESCTLNETYTRMCYLRITPTYRDSMDLCRKLRRIENSNRQR